MTWFEKIYGVTIDDYLPDLKVDQPVRKPNDELRKERREYTVGRYSHKDAKSYLAKLRRCA